MNGIVSPIFIEKFWLRYYGERWGRCGSISNTQTYVTRWCHVTFWPRDSNAIFEGKIAQLCELIKSTIFIVGISKFGIVPFKCYIFILCGNKFLLHRHFKNIPIICIFKHFLSITVANFQDSIPLLYRQNYLADNHGRDFHFLYLPVRFSFSLLSKQNYLADDYRRHFRAFIILTELLCRWSWARFSSLLYTGKIALPMISTLYSQNRPFAGSGHMVRNKLHWDANDAVRLPKQRKVGLDW